MIFDIGASKNNREPDYALLAKIARECRMPLCYGGGIISVSQIERLVGLGIERVALNTSLIEHPKLLSDASSLVGSQSLVAVIDMKRVGLFQKTYVVVKNNGMTSTAKTLLEWSSQLEALGVGEIVIQAVDRDGMLSGYDFDLIDLVWGKISVPITVLGGAGSFNHIEALFARYGLVGAAAGSLFSVKGKFRAPLVSYPSRSEKEAIINKALTL